MDQNNPSITGVAQFSGVRDPRPIPQNSLSQGFFVEKSRYVYFHNHRELEPETCANRFSIYENLKNVARAFGLILRLDKVMNRPKSEK